jgi:hypothetical protein
MDSISSADADILLNRRANAQRSAATRSSSGSAVRTPRALQGAVQDLTGGGEGNLAAGGQGESNDRSAVSALMKIAPPHLQQYPIRGSLFWLLSWVPPNLPGPLLGRVTGLILFSTMTTLMVVVEGGLVCRITFVLVQKCVPQAAM